MGDEGEKGREVLKVVSRAGMWVRGTGSTTERLGAGHRGCVVPVARCWPRDHRQQLQEDPCTGWSVTTPEGVAAPWGVLGNCYGTPPDELNTLLGLE